MTFRRATNRARAAAALAGLVVSGLVIDGCSTAETTGSAGSMVVTGLPPSPLDPTPEQEAALDARFTRQQVCEDYELALHLLALVQSPSETGRGDNVALPALQADLASCPGTYVGVGRELRRRQMALKDLHTNFSMHHADDGAPLDLDATRNAVILKCNTPGACDGLVGASVSPVLSEVEGHFYGFAPRGATGSFTFEIMSVDGASATDVWTTLQASELCSRKAAGGINGGCATTILLGRRPLDGRDRKSMTLTLRDLTTNATSSVTTTFDAVPTVSPTDAAKKLAGAAYAIRAYGCKDVANNSTDTVGACVTTAGRGVVWIRSWDLTSDDSDPFDLVDPFLLGHPAILAEPVILDTRGNGGGTVLRAMQFACGFGGASTLASMNARRFVVSTWPESVTLSSGKTLDLSTLETDEGTELVQFSAGWKVSSAAPDVHRRVAEMGLFERIRFSADTCADSSDPALAKLRWVTLMNGAEASAQEDFVSLFDHSPSAMRTTGSRTSGASGAPVSVVLPNTKMVLRISLARQFDSRDGVFKIEGVGLAPDVPDVRDDPADFEARVKLVFGGQKIGFTDGAHAARLFHDALGIEIAD